MKKHFTLIVLILSFFTLSLSAQNFTISGHVSDRNTGEKLIGANIYNSKTLRGTTSNNFGFYSISFSNKDTICLVVSYIGYTPQVKKFELHANLQLDFELEQGTSLKEIQVVASKENPIEKRNEMSVVSIPVKQIEALPAIGGEPDIMKAMQLMPGVQSGSELSSGLYVRGGSPDQNLVVLDDVPLYYVNHLGGLVSIFNTDAINNVKLIKGGFPAQYGSRLSSIMDVRMKEGNLKEFQGSGMIGMLTSKIELEGPIKKDISSYMISCRRFFYDLFTRPITKLTQNGVSFGYNFYDFNSKINYRISSKDRIYLSLYTGDDKIITVMKDRELGEKNTFRSIMQWGNNLVALRWNHQFGQKLFGNLTTTHTRYRLLMENTNKNLVHEPEQKFKNKFTSGIFDFNVKLDLEYYISQSYKMKFGTNSILHTFKPGVTSYLQKENNVTTMDTSFGKYQLNAFENAFYVENEIYVAKLCNLNIGGRFSSYQTENENFYSIEPRLMINVPIKEKLSVKGSYSEMQQNVHLLTNSGVGMPTDLWVPACRGAEPSKSKQVAVGIAKSIQDNLFELSIEGYCKKMNNLITYKDGANYLGSSDSWLDKIENKGKGESYGIELLVQKKIGKTTGWIGYTLSKTSRQFNNINDGKVFPYKYDRRHDISLAFIHKLNDHVDISATWVFCTGRALTLATSQYNIIKDARVIYTDGGITILPDDKPFNYDTDAYIYGEKNAFRMKPFHKLDVGINFHKKKKWGERTWNISIYNAYNHQNPYFYYYDTTGEYDKNGNFIEGTEKTVLKQQSLFPIMPSVSYSFKF